MRSLNKRIVVTRDAKQSITFGAILRNAGALVFYLPLINVVPLKKTTCPLALSEFDWFVATSVNAVHYFGDCLRAAGKSYADLTHCRVAAIGKTTAGALRELGVEVSLVPETQVSGPLVDALLKSEHSPEGKRVLFPQGTLAKPGIARALEAAGMSVTRITCYETTLRQPDVAELQEFMAFSPEAVTFFSPSAVHAFSQAGFPQKMAGSSLRPVYVSIGPVTTRALADDSLTPVIEAAQQHENGMLEILQGYFS